MNDGHDNVWLTYSRSNLHLNETLLEKSTTDCSNENCEDMKSDDSALIERHFKIEILP